jgi:hypothetical protein
MCSENHNINQGAKTEVFFAANDEKRFVVHADEKLTALLELEAAIRVAANWLDKLA